MIEWIDEKFGMAGVFVSVVLFVSLVIGGCYGVSRLLENEVRQISRQECRGG